MPFVSDPYCFLLRPNIQKANSPAKIAFLAGVRYSIFTDAITVWKRKWFKIQDLIPILYTHEEFRKGGSGLRKYSTMIKHGLLGICLCFLASCSSSVSLSHKPKLLHFSTPETTGGWGDGSVDVTASRSEPEYVFGSIDYLNTAVQNQASSTQESIKKNSGYINLNAWIGLLENLDAYINLQGVVGIKAQLLGESRQAKKEGLKLTLETRMAKGISTKESTSNFVSDVIDAIFKNDSQANTSTSTNIFDISCNLGYRYSPQNLVYINTFLNINSFSGELWSDADNIYRKATTTSKTYGALLGFNYTTESDIYYTIEAGATRTIWSNRGSLWAYPFGISYGRMW